MNYDYKKQQQYQYVAIIVVTFIYDKIDHMAYLMLR